MSRPFGTRTLVVFGTLFLVVAASSGAAFGAVRIVKADGNRVEVLGSGDNVSIRVTTGRADLLIATGNDRTAFGNAYERVSIAPRARPDILLLAGSGRSLNVPTHALDLYADANTYAIHPLHAEQAGEVDLAALAPLPRNPLRFTLDERIVVVVESRPLEGEDDRYAWRALITREHSRVAVLSSQDHAGLFTWTDPVSVLVIAGGTVQPGEQRVDATAIVASPASLSVPDGETANPFHLVPVRPGSIATIRFVDSGIELTSDDRMSRADPP